MRKYSHKYLTLMYRPLSEWSIPIIDRDTEPYWFCIPNKFTDMRALVLHPPPWWVDCQTGLAQPGPLSGPQEHHCFATPRHR